MSIEKAINGLKTELATKNELYLSVRVRANANKTEITDFLADNSLKLSVKAAPEKGKANEEITAFLAKTFGVPRSNIKLISGAADRHKLFKLHGLK